MKSDNEEEEDPDVEEASVAASIAGYSLPLGASNFGTTLKQRGEYSARSFGGGATGKPTKKSTRKRKKTSRKRKKK